MRLDLRLEQVLPHPVERVWGALIDRHTLGRWLMANNFEPHVGRRFTLRDAPVGGWRGWFECEVLELDPPRRMVWAWHGGMPGEAITQVVFELRPSGDGTRLVLRHYGAGTLGQLDSVRDGWTRHLSSLRRALAPGLFRRVSFGAPCDPVFDAIATLDGLRRWWPSSVDGSAAPGGELRLSLDGACEELVARVEQVWRPDSLRWAGVSGRAGGGWRGTAVCFELVERSGAGCQLAMRHLGLGPAAPRGALARTWDRLLERLTMALDGAGTSDAPPRTRGDPATTHDKGHGNQRL